MLSHHCFYFLPKDVCYGTTLGQEWYDLNHQAQTAIYLHKPVDREFQEKFTKREEKKTQKTRKQGIEL